MPEDQPIATPESPPGAAVEQATTRSGGDEVTGNAGAGAADVAELEALRTQLVALQEEREAVEAIAIELQQADARAEQLRVELTEVRAAQLAAHRRAVLAEHRGQLVEELVMGDSPETIDASVELAQAAYARVAGQLRQQAAAVVPAGASPRGEPSADHLSPFEKIAGALRR